MIGPYIAPLKEHRIRNINLNLEVLDQESFFRIIRRDTFPEVYQNLQSLSREDFNKELSFVVMGGKNLNDILPENNQAV